MYEELTPADQIWAMGMELGSPGTGDVQRELLHLLGWQCEAHLVRAVSCLLEGTIPPLETRPPLVKVPVSHI